MCECVCVCVGVWKWVGGCVGVGMDGDRAWAWEDEVESGFVRRLALDGAGWRWWALPWRWDRQRCADWARELGGRTLGWVGCCQGICGLPVPVDGDWEIPGVGWACVW